ncbi:ferredoxin [Salipiger sp. 1_MG-2023]|uniref:ferredoxin n=1 Tax=Salipiger sp. 1_MG-2023 TaxID=3062665 RepID=UPI0026E1C2F0|nr:ferredoxin [Salipiger sp. 1_MG-2023]MDO6587725.1 ferredoxin [Salipiger sp. 1_MG-2023]
MSLAALEIEAQAQGLTLRGAFHPAPDSTLVLLGPDEPRFWARFREAPEFCSTSPDPLDLWSKRVIGDLARRWQGDAIYPSDGPPFPDFLGWARQSGQAHASPINLLVHVDAGLLVSYRGAVILPQRIALPPARPSPCDSCAGVPCTTACPVQALRPGAPYDVAACQRHLRSPEGADCRDFGCKARRACPLSVAMRRPPAQAAFHMAAFMKD